MSEESIKKEVRLNQFAREIGEGLQSKPKRLPSKFFYDAEGDRIFRKIMKMTEYYLTRCEYEIILENRDHMFQLFADNRPFDLVELGAGDGSKTRILLNHLLRKNANVTYRPVDISRNALSLLVSSLAKMLPDLNVQPEPGEYLKALRNIESEGTRRKVILFLGSSIGNFNLTDAKTFFVSLKNLMHPGDLLLTGFDLKKDPHVILKAYNDPAGITRDFNLNLLIRINREAGANFNLSSFKHYPTYNPENGEARSYLLSTKKQEVFIAALEKIFHFDRWEPIHTEVSKKYSIQQTDEIADEAGFEVIHHYLDEKKYFLDTLWMA